MPTPSQASPWCCRTGFRSRSCHHVPVKSYLCPLLWVRFQGPLSIRSLSVSTCGQVCSGGMPRLPPLLLQLVFARYGPSVWAVLEDGNGCRSVNSSKRRLNMPLAFHQPSSLMLAFLVQSLRDGEEGWRNSPSGCKKSTIFETSGWYFFLKNGKGTIRNCFLCFRDVYSSYISHHYVWFFV